MANNRVRTHDQDQVNPDRVQILRAKVTSRLHAQQAINDLFLMIIISLILPTIY